MGLFSDETIITVASSAYNLAGPEDKRPNFLKTTVASSILTPGRSMADVITNAYLTGPAINFRNFGHWAISSGYNTALGLTSTGQLSLVASIDAVALAPLIPNDTGKPLLIQTSAIGSADYSFWVDQYMAAFHQTLIAGKDYVSDFDGTTITITFPDTSFETFEPAGFDPLGQFLYVTYIVMDDVLHPGDLQTLSGFGSYIYQRGSGNTDLDAFFVTATGGDTYLPYIPLRVDNTWVSDSFLPDVYPLAIRATKKSLNADYNALQVKIQDNPHIDDIDFAYVVFGVSLNCVENAGKRYIYEFFKTAMIDQDLSGTSFSEWLTAFTDIYSKRVTYTEWYDAQLTHTPPLYGEPAPEFTPGLEDMLSYPAPPVYTIKVNSPELSVMQFDMEIAWNGIIESSHSGLGKPDAKKGDLWFEVVPRSEDDPPVILDAGGIVTVPTLNLNQTLLHWQVDEDTYTTLTIWGLGHNNYVYGRISIFIDALDALADTAESGFIVPLNTTIYRAMPMVLATQMSTCSSYLILNSYEKKKIAWYASGWFQVFITILVIVVTVAITVYTGGAGAPGLLGTAAEVGAAAGATGLTAVILGATINAIAAMIVVQLITQGATAIFGSKVGSIVGTIAAFAAITYGTGVMSGLENQGFDQLLSASNLLRITSSILDGASKFIEAGTQDILKEGQLILKGINDESQNIEAKYEELISSNMVIDPLGLTNTFSAPLLESPDNFFTRTLMTGSDIAGLSLDLIGNFADINLRTDLPI